MTGEFCYIRAIEPPTKIYYLCVSIKGFLDPLGIAFGGASSKGSFILCGYGRNTGVPRQGFPWLADWGANPRNQDE